MTTRTYQNWKIPSLATTPAATHLAESLDLPRIVARILHTRGLDAPERIRGFLDPGQYFPTPPEALPDVVVAVGMLSEVIATRSPVLVWGDFDVDGQTATALLLDGLRMLGASVSAYVPHRLRESHGIQVTRLAQLIDERKPALLLTCDTGITAFDAITYANQHGLAVIVTDHHDLAPEGLPPAAANINPKRLPPQHALRSLPGVGVTYKLMQALFANLGRDPSDLHQLLDLVALGIVGDVAEQTYDTRYLLQLGMEELRSTRRIGLRALLEVAQLNPAHITTESIGFQIAPRLNAAGRLDDAAMAIELLTTTDSRRAALIAEQLDGLNKKRRVMQRQILAAAKDQLAEYPDLLDHTALVIYKSDWHTGLLGIVAGQLAQEFERPCVMLTSTANQDLAAGSARSFPGHDIGAAIAAQAELLNTYGGHPGAAGVSLPVDHINQFRRALSRTLDENYDASARPDLTIDAEVSLAEITPELVETLFTLAPFGEGNPPLMLLTRSVAVTNDTVIGREGLHRRLTIAQSDGITRDIIWWNGMEHTLPQGHIDIVFQPGWSTYQGRREMALTFVDARRNLDDEAEAPSAPERSIHDWRSISAEAAYAQFTMLEPEGQIWVEGLHSQVVNGLKRLELRPAEALLIYTAPPSRAVLNSVLDAVGATRLYVLGYAPPDSNQHAFYRVLIGMCRHTINKRSGIADLDAMAAALGQNVDTVLWGLRFAAANNTISLEEHETATKIGTPDAEPAITDLDISELSAIVQQRLAEARYYRQYFATAELSSLFM